MPQRPDPSSTLTGIWSGDVTESYGGRGRLHLVIQQAQLSLSGTFHLEFQDPSHNRSGTLHGNAAFSTVPQRMQWSSPLAFDCGPGQIRESFLLVSWAQAGDTLKGDYSGFGCVGSITGSFEAVRGQ